MKPTLAIAGTYHYSTEELMDSFEELKSVFDITPKRYEEFEAKELAPFLLIVIANLPGGFLKAIGEEAWELLKTKISGIIVRPDKRDSDLELQIVPDKGLLIFKCRSNDSLVFRSALDEVVEIVNSSRMIDGTKEYRFEKAKNKRVP